MLVLSIGVHYLWTILDFEPVEEMGVDYRETNFLHNRKSWNRDGEPFQSAARTALAPLKHAGRERTMYVQYPSEATGFGNDDSKEGRIEAWEFKIGTSEMDALDAWWALHTAIPEVDESELLLVNPHIISSSFAEKMYNHRRVPGYKPSSPAEREIIAVYDKLRWCIERGSPIVIFENIVGRSSPDYACHGKGKLPPP